MLTVSAATYLYILRKSILVQPVVVKAGSLWNPITRAKVIFHFVYQKIFLFFFI